MIRNFLKLMLISIIIGIPYSIIYRYFNMEVAPKYVKDCAWIIMGILSYVIWKYSINKEKKEKK